LIRVEHLSVSYGSRQALDDVSLRISEGEFLLITGPSGCGKTTLARCLNGLIPHAFPSEMSGEVTVAGQATSTGSVATLATSVGLVFQNPAHQLFNLNVDEEVAFGPRNLGIEETEVSRRVDWALEATGITRLRGRSIHTLSGGEKQRLAIASVLAMGPRILILDEPTASLDVEGTRCLMETLARLNAVSGVTIVVVEHRLGEVAHLTRRAVVMARGRVVADGPTGDVLSRRELLRTYGLRRPSDEIQDDWMELLGPNSDPPGPPIIELHDVQAGYGRTTVLRDLNLMLYEGELAAVVGDNGAGKTTLARLLAGVIRARKGDVRLGNGNRLNDKGDIGLLFQNPLDQLFCETVDEEIGFGPRNFGCFDPIRLNPILDAAQLASLRRFSVQSLSAGEQQRTALAAVLALEPRLVILDEPTMGQDWGHLSRFMDFLSELNRTGTTFLLITHDYRLVHRYARRILLLRHGRIVADGSPAGIETNTRGDLKYDSQFVSWSI
jgi:energy-coupling factor transporter ATP-binding protein EcfA2